MSIISEARSYYNQYSNFECSFSTTLFLCAGQQQIWFAKESPVHTWKHLHICCHNRHHVLKDYRAAFLCVSGISAAQLVIRRNIQKMVENQQTMFLNFPMPPISDGTQCHKLLRLILSPSTVEVINKEHLCFQLIQCKKEKYWHSQLMS